MAENSPSKFGTWIVYTLIAGVLLAILLFFLFPQLVSKLTGLIVGLLAVVTGLFLRRKK